MKIIFLGEQSKGYFLKEYAEKKGDEIHFTGEMISSQEAGDYILNCQSNLIVIDIRMFLDESDVIAVNLSRAVTAANIKTIIYAAGYSPDSEIIKALIQNQFTSFIYSVYQGLQIEEIEKILDGTDSSFAIKSEDVKQEEKPVYNNIKRISVMGSDTKIGTTTAAVNICKYLTYNGYKAAYIEINDTHYIEACQQLYVDVRFNEETGCISYAGVDMYPAASVSLIQQQYDYLIFDYGYYWNKNFQKLSFLEKDIKIALGGVKPNEIARTQPLLSNDYYKDMYYVFNFVSEADRKDVLEMMGNMAARTLFWEYTPDPFTLNIQNPFTSILKVAPRQKGRRFFPFGGVKSEKK